MNRESNRLKKSRSDWLNSGNALMQHLSEKMRFSRFRVLSGSAEAHVPSGGIKAKFHYASWFEASSKLVADRSNLLARASSLLAS